MSTRTVIFILMILQLSLFGFAIIRRSFVTVSPKRVVLITDTGNIDDGGFNQASWEAIQNYCEANKISYEYYRPSSFTEIAMHEQIRVAVKNGADIIVCPGFSFMAVVDEAQKKFKDVHFVLLDAETTNSVCPNTVCIQYEMEISGFLAGYTVAQDLMKYDLNHGGVKKNYGYGYCGGMANSGVYPFGFGYVQGVIRGTKDFVEANKCEAPFLTINYNYAHVFSQDDNAVSRCKGWYMGEKENKIDVIFVCGGKLYQSIIEAATYCNNIRGINLDNNLRNAARWIGVDTDQRKAMVKKDEKLICYTSALKNLGNSIQTVLDYHFSNAWDKIGGPYSTDKKSWTAGLNFKIGRNEDQKGINYVGIPIGTEKNSNVLEGFFNFTIDDYNAIADKIINTDEYKIFNGFESFGSYGGDKDKNRGNPKFMNKNKSFINKYLGGYDNFNIVFYE